MRSAGLPHTLPCLLRSFLCPLCLSGCQWYLALIISHLPLSLLITRPWVCLLVITWEVSHHGDGYLGQAEKECETKCDCGSEGDTGDRRLILCPSLTANTSNITHGDCLAKWRSQSF